MGTQDVGGAVAQHGSTEAHDLICLLFVNSVWKRMSAERRVFRDGTGGLWTIGRNTAGKNKFANSAAASVDFCDRLHDACCACDVDLPHAALIEHSGALRIDDECQVKNLF